MPSSVFLTTKFDEENKSKMESVAFRVSTHAMNYCYRGFLWNMLSSLARTWDQMRRERWYKCAPRQEIEQVAEANDIQRFTTCVLTFNQNIL